MIVRRFLAVLVTLLVYACSDSSSNGVLVEDGAGDLASALAAPHTPANENLIRSLLRGELGSDPVYLIVFRELRNDLEDTPQLLREYNLLLQEKLSPVGAYVAFENALMQQITNPGGAIWHEVMGMYFPSPQALLDVLQDPGYQSAVMKEHAATARLHSFLVKPLIVRQPVDLQPERDEFYMANLNQYRERALYPDGTDRGLTGREADTLYGERMLAEVLPGINAYPVLAGEYSYMLLGSDSEWSSFALVRYPSFPEFLNMIVSPRFQELVVNKNAGLARATAIATSPKTAFLLSQ
ncbi:MAG: hypothetical protein GY887_01845 [Halieaceae bacterium]|nr:hypothetical protein [Halieaceae bacterium]